MDPSGRLLTGAAPGSTGATDESSLLQLKQPGVKCDIVNECQMFLKAEDGGGDTRLSLNEPPEQETIESPEFLTSTPDQKKEDPTDNKNSNPGFSMEGMPEHPSGAGLPETVTVLDAPDGGKIYLVGTAHFSLESQEDVAKVIQKVQPHIVVVELCGQRTNILMLDEEIILKEAKNINIQKIRATVAQNGVFNGLMYILLLNMSAHITRELGMAPGGEFRRAMAEAKKIPYCMVHLGDRAIDVTLHRAIASLSWGQTIRFIWHLLTSNQTISLEEVEKCKQKKMLEDMLDEMAEEFPALKRVFVVERDMYLCHSLQVAAMQPQFYVANGLCIECEQKKNDWLLPQFRPRSKSLPSREPCRIVGVVGIGHVAGIVEHWGKIQPEDIKPLLKVPPPSLSTRIVRVSVRAAFTGALLYAGYRIVRRLMP